MLRSNRILCAVLVCTVVGVAFAGARRITSFETFDPEPAAADGMAVINYVSGQDRTVVQVILSDFTPNESYVVIIGNAGPMTVDRTDPSNPMLLVSNPDDTMIAGQFGSIRAGSSGHVTVHLSNAPGDGGSSLDAVGVCTLDAYQNRAVDQFGTERTAVRAFAF